MSKGLSIKDFGSGPEGDQGLNLGSLENNPNYKPEGAGEGGPKPEGEGVENIETGEPQTGEPSNNNGQPKVSPETGEPQIGEPESSLNNGQPEEGKQVQEITDESALRYLSEKLGRDVSSFEDLTQVQENPLEKDPYLKSLSEWRERTGRPLEDWINFQKDYSEMDDLSVAREILQLKYPELDEASINLELEQYTPVEDDLEREVNFKKLQLKKLAIEGRKELNRIKGELDTPDSSYLTPDIQKDLSFAKEIREHMDLSSKENENYQNLIKDVSSKIESINLNLGNDFNLDFKISEEDRKDLPNMVFNAPHWKNENGSWNHEAVVKDAIKLKHFDKILSLVREQGSNSGKEDIIKDAKNTTLDNSNTAKSEQGNKQKGDIIEGGIDSLLEKKGLSIRF